MPVLKVNVFENSPVALLVIAGLVPELTNFVPSKVDKVLVPSIVTVYSMLGCSGASGMITAWIGVSIAVRVVGVGHRLTRCHSRAVSPLHHYRRGDADHLPRSYSNDDWLTDWIPRQVAAGNRVRRLVGQLVGRAGGAFARIGLHRRAIRFLRERPCARPVAICVIARGPKVPVVPVVSLLKTRMPNVELRRDQVDCVIRRA